MKTRVRNAAATAGYSIGGYLLILAAVVGVAGVAAFVWWLTVAFSGPAGAGNVQRDQNSAANREHWSATFNAEFDQLQADQGNIATLKTAATAPGATVQDRTNYAGAQLNCRQDVATYTADASSVLGRPWIPEGLPTTVTADTYCGN